MKSERKRNKPRAGRKTPDKTGAPGRPPVTGRRPDTAPVAPVAASSGKPAKPSAPRPELPPRRKPSTKRLPQTIGTLLESPPDADYALLDSGDGLKLERYGDLRIVRPEAQAMWQKSLPAADWTRVDAIFTGDTDEEGLGRWHFPGRQLEETFPMRWDGMAYHGRFTSFRHTGVFPEQAAHWRFMMKAIESSKAQEKLQAKVKGSDQPRILNLFGYTGIASLVAARSGAHVTHVDASKKAIAWARENQELAGLEDRPIRWICEDAVKFCEREVRRGSTYDGILLDPPAFGRGPKGEVWQLFEHLPHMVDLCREMMSERPLFCVLTAYTIRTSFLAVHELMQEVFGDAGGRLDSGELNILTEGSQRRISTSMFSRWVRPGISGGIDT